MFCKAAPKFKGDKLGFKSGSQVRILSWICYLLACLTILCPQVFGRRLLATKRSDNKGQKTSARHQSNILIFTKVKFDFCAPCGTCPNFPFWCFSKTQKKCYTTTFISSHLLLIPVTFQWQEENEKFKYVSPLNNDDV